MLNRLMFREMLRLQWRWSMPAILLCGAGVFAVPMMSVRNARVAEAIGLSQTELAHYFLEVMERWSPLYTGLAALLGLWVATSLWAADHRGRHVYALSLPVERWRFVLMRFWGGALLLLAPAFLLLIGSLLAAGVADIPAGLQSYPLALAFRFLLASFVAFSLFFAISSGTTRTAAYVLAPLAIVAVTQVLLDAAGLRTDILGNVGEWLMTSPGILEVFTGRWLLIDV